MKRGRPRLAFERTRSLVPTVKFTKIALVAVGCVWVVTSWVGLFHQAEWRQAHVTSSDDFHIVSTLIEGTIETGLFVAVALAFWVPQRRALRWTVGILAAIHGVHWYPILAQPGGVAGWVLAVVILAAITGVFWRGHGGIVLGRIVIVASAAGIVYLFFSPVWEAFFSRPRERVSFLDLMCVVPQVFSGLGLAMLTLPWVPADRACKIAPWLLFVTGSALPWGVAWSREFRDSTIDLLAWTGPWLFLLAGYALFCLHIFRRRAQWEAGKMAGVTEPEVRGAAPSGLIGRRHPEQDAGSAAK